jgi:hypothetical protein
MAERRISALGGGTVHGNGALAGTEKGHFDTAVFGVGRAVVAFFGKLFFTEL